MKQSTLSIIALKRAGLNSSKYILKSYLPYEKIYKLKNETENYKNSIIGRTDKEFNTLKFQLELMREKLSGYNYSKQMDNGFALVSDENGNMVRNIKQVKVNKQLNIRFKDFKVQAEIINIEEVK